jgi:hypothetical protein
MASQKKYEYNRTHDSNYLGHSIKGFDFDFS